MPDLCDAAESGDQARIQHLLSLRPVGDINETRDGQTALFIASNLSHQTIVGQLLNAGADANIVDNEGRTALMAATNSGALDVVQLLLPATTDVNQCDFHHKTAFDYAKFGRHKQVVRTLLNVSARPGKERVVLVLGAGFTRAFLPSAPLLVDNYGMDGALTRKYHELQYANEILQDELERTRPRGNGKVDLERLMTRLDGGMPYDENHAAVNQLRSLLDDVKMSFLKKLNDAKLNDVNQGTFHQDELRALAKECIRRNITIVTFNYDDVLDEEMQWGAVQYNTRWSLNRGYGFFCRASDELQGMTFGSPYYEEPPATILKLHGSINWRLLLGANEPIKSNEIFHHSSWFNRNMQVMDKNFDALGTQFQPQPFIVPPVLTKASLTRQPLLQLLWTKAYDALTQADRVIFVGYSLPVTDIASASLLTEGMSMMPDYPNVEVVGLASNSTEEDALKTAYRHVFPNLNDTQFRFDGALNWAASFVTPPSATP